VNKKHVMRRALRNSGPLTLFLAGAMITGLGGFITGRLGWGDPANGWAFKQTVIDQKSEVVSLVSNIPCATASHTCVTYLRHDHFSQP